MLKLTITNSEGEVFEVLAQDVHGQWTDSDGEPFGSTKDLLRHGIADLLDSAARWAAITTLNAAQDAANRREGTV